MYVCMCVCVCVYTCIDAEAGKAAINGQAKVSASSVLVYVCDCIYIYICMFMFVYVCLFSGLDV